MQLSLGRRKYVAVDYDRQEIRLVVFDYVRKAPVIRSLHTAAIKSQVDVSDAASLGRYLAAVVSRLGLSGARALMCVGRSQAALKSLSLPPAADANELASMVQFQVSRELPFSPEEAVVDYTHGPHWGAGQAGQVPEPATTVLAAAVRLPLIDAARQLCVEAALKLWRLGLRPYANMRTVYRCVRAQPGERLLLVSITADEAEIDVMRDQMLEFSRSATVAAPAEADEAEARAQCVRRVVAEVTRSLQSFHAVERGAQINLALVAGGTGVEKELAESLSAQLSVPCALLDPSAGFAIASSQALGAFGAALGLAAGQAAEPLPFDFLNPKRPAEPKDKRRTRAAAIAAAAGVLVAAVALGANSYLSSKHTLVDNLKKHNESLLKQNASLRKLQDSVSSADIWLKSEGDWLNELRRLSQLLPGKEAYLTSFKCSAGKMLLVGRVKNRQTALDFAEKLTGVPGYEVVNKGTNPVRSDKFGYGLEFNFEVLVRPPGSAKTMPASGPAASKPGRTGPGR